MKKLDEYYGFKMKKLDWSDYPSEMCDGIIIVLRKLELAELKRRLEVLS